MRLSAYKKAIDQAWELSKEIPELVRYFRKGYSPREEAANYIIGLAMRDSSIYQSELGNLLDYVKDKYASDNKTEQQVSSQEGSSEWEQLQGTNHCSGGST